MENKENNINSSNINSNSQIKTDLQSPNQEISKNQINTPKNSVIFRNKKIDKKNKILDDIYEDNLDHPKPLASDFEERDDLRKTLILQEIKENNINRKKITQNNKVQNLNDEYFKIVNDIEKVQISLNNEKNQKKIVRVNLNEINKNKFKIKKKEENKNNNSKIKNEEEKLIIRVRNSKAQNPFKEKDTNFKNKINYNNSVKFNYKQIRQNKTNSTEKNNHTSSQLIKRTITRPIINKYNCYKNNTNRSNNNNTIQIQNKNKESQYLTSHKQNCSLNDKNFYNYNTIKISEKKSSGMLIPKIKITSDINNINNRPYLNQIYVSENYKNMYMFHRKNKNCSNSITTDADSSKEKNIKIKNDKLKLNEKEGILKQTVIKGGKFNNIQTTYIISSKKSSDLTGIIKVNKNPILNYKLNDRIKNLTLNNINNINNYFTKTPSKINTETINTLNSPRNNIHICEKNPKKDAFHNYALNTAKNSKKTTKKILLEKNKENISQNYSIPKNRYNNKNIINYNYKNESNLKKIKYYNLTRSTDNNMQYFDDNSTINYDTYNNTLDYNLYWNIPQGNNYQVYDLKYYSRYYNY